MEAVTNAEPLLIIKVWLVDGKVLVVHVMPSGLVFAPAEPTAHSRLPFQAIADGPETANVLAVQVSPSGLV